MKKIVFGSITLMTILLSSVLIFSDYTVLEKPFGKDKTQKKRL